MAEAKQSLFYAIFETEDFDNYVKDSAITMFYRLLV